MTTIAETTPVTEKKSALVTLAEHITALEARITELERCKHDGHTIGEEALQQISARVMQDLAATLLPSPPKQVEEQVEETEDEE